MMAAPFAYKSQFQDRLQKIIGVDNARVITINHKPGELETALVEVILTQEQLRKIGELYVEMSKER